MRSAAAPVENEKEGGVAEGGGAKSPWRVGGGDHAPPGFLPGCQVEGRRG